MEIEIVDQHERMHQQIAGMSTKTRTNADKDNKGAAISTTYMSSYTVVRRGSDSKTNADDFGNVGRCTVG